MPKLIATSARLSRSTAAKIAALIVGFTLLSNMILFTMFRAQEPKFQDMAMVELKRAALRLSDSIDRNLFERYGDVQAFASHPAAVAASGGKTEAALEVVEAMDTYMALYGIYKLMILADTEGNVLAANSKDAKGKKIDSAFLAKQNFKDASWFQSVVAGRFLEGRNGFTGTVVEQPSRSTEVARVTGDDGLALPFATAVKDEAGKTIGVWVNFAGFDLVEDIMVQIYGSLAADGLKTAELTLVDPKGTVIGSYDPHHDGKIEYQRDAGVIGKLNLVAANVKGVKEAVEGKTGFVVDSFHARKKTTVPVGYTRSAGAYDYPGLGWSALVRAAPEEAFATVSEIQSVMAWLVLSSALLLAIAGLVVGRFAARPIVRLTSAMRGLADGDTTIEVPATRRGDEIGDMARTIEVFKQNALRVAELTRQREVERARSEQDQAAALQSMADMIERELATAVDLVADRAKKMSENAMDTEKAVRRVDSNASSVAAASEQALANAQSVASASTELSASIDEISRQVASAAAATQSARQTGDATRVSILELANVVTKIGDVTRLIAEIASQTNLLALNATIEAARAGDAGKGFAVVAGEVKNLATQTARSTDDISKLIEEIRRSTSRTVEQVTKSTEDLKGIDQITTSVAAAVEEQSSATREISRSVEETSSAAREVAARIADVSTEAAGTSERARVASTLAGELNDMVGAIRTTVIRSLRSSVEQIDRRKSPRHAVATEAEFVAGSRRGRTRVANLSRGGAQISEGLPPGSKGTLSIAGLGVPPLPFVVVGSTDGRSHLRFEAPAEEIERIGEAIDRFVAPSPAKKAA